MILLAIRPHFADTLRGYLRVMKHYQSLISKAIFAGLLVAIAGVIYLALYTTHKVVGAMLFSFALLLVVTYQLNLFTGKIGYLFDHKPRYIVDILLIIVGNLIGSIAIALIVRLASLDGVISQALTLSTSKLDASPFANFGRAILCGMMMYFAVDGFKKIKMDLLRVLVVIFAVMIFILAGFEHSVANMFYFTVSGSISWKSFGTLIIMLLGNGVGAILINLLERVAVPSLR